MPLPVAATYHITLLDKGGGRPQHVELIPAGVVLRSGSGYCVRRYELAIPLRRLEDARVDARRHRGAVRLQGRHGLLIRQYRHGRRGEHGGIRKLVRHPDDVDGRIVAVLRDQPHGVARLRVVHDGRPQTETGDIRLEGVKSAIDQTADLQGIHLNVGRAAVDIEHVQGEHERIRVVAEVARIIGVEHRGTPLFSVVVTLKKNQSAFVSVAGDADLETAMSKRADVSRAYQRPGRRR